MTMQEIIAELRSNTTVSVPFAGKALGDLSKNVSYDAAKKGTLGVEVFSAGGKLRVASITVLRKLGLEPPEIADKVSVPAAAANAVAAKASRPQKTPVRSKPAVQARRALTVSEMEAARALLAKIASGELVLTEASKLTPELSD
jgi:hypothetical protein